MFLKYRKNIFSQNGEDGVIQEILRRLKLKKRNKWCCEFGAWDGKHGSNTFNLVKNYKYNAVYIEGDKSKFKKLLITKSKYQNIIALNKYISHKKNHPDQLDKVLKKTKIIKYFDILSIDIDSFDLDVWKSLKKYRPKIVIIEINSGISPGIEQIHSKYNIGNSFTSTVNYANKVNYQLICHTGNCIFVDKKYSKKLRIDKKFANNNNVDLLFDRSWLNKKDFFIKRLIKFMIPKKFIEFMRSYI